MNPPLPLDPELTREVLEVMKKLAKSGMTMLVVSHEMGFAASVANQIIFMENGNIVEQGPPDALLYDPAYVRTRKSVGQFADLTQRKD